MSLKSTPSFSILAILFTVKCFSSFEGGFRFEIEGTGNKNLYLEHLQLSKNWDYIKRYTVEDIY